ncbi:LytR family transcriptional regulator [bacterium]|nr:MAG: LytR family transcriptional regulator [bacterium]
MLFRKPQVRIAVWIAAGVLILAVGYRLLGGAVLDRLQHQAAMQSAQSAFGSHKLNVLILGYQDDEGTSDTVILAHLDVDRRTGTLVSIPRDSWVAIPGHGHWKINAAMGYGGPQLAAKVIGVLTGAPIDATIAIQPEGAAQIVDAMGGLNVDVDETMNYDDNYGRLHIHLKKGEQYLTGSQVVGYMRFRHDAASDWGRMHRQQQVLTAMMNQLSQPQNWAKLPRLLQFARKDLKTTLSGGQLAALLEIYRGVPQDNIRTFTLPAKAGWVGDASVVFVDQRWAKLIGRFVFTKNEPPQDQVLVANATGNTELDKTLIGAMRGGGWNVQTFVDESAKPASLVLGSSPAARALAQAFAVKQTPSARTTLVLGEDLAPGV